jgi:hypothetical protein
MNCLILYRIRFRGIAVAIIMFALSLICILPVRAQGGKSKTQASDTPKGPGSVSGAPHLPAGFTETFTSRYIDIGGLRLHAVIGGKGRPLLLIHGWPQTWYQWRLVMPALARDFQVIAVDQRGIGLSDKPQGGYDSGTQANDLVKLMEDPRSQAVRCGRLRYRHGDRIRDGRRSFRSSGALGSR